MMHRQTLKTIIVDQHAIALPQHYYEREAFAKIDAYKEAKEAVIITGLRRSGKSTLVQMLRKQSELSEYTRSGSGCYCRIK